MIGSFVFLTAIRAAWKVRHVNSFLCFFFVSQGLYAIAVWSAYFLMGANDAVLDKLSYKLIYALFTLICLFPITVLSMLAIDKHPKTETALWCSLGIAALSTAIAWYGVKHLTFGLTVQLFEGCVLVGSGCGALFSAPFKKRSFEVLTDMTLAFLWLGQGIFRLGYIQHVKIPSWETANVVLPAFFFIAATLWISSKIGRFQFSFVAAS